MKRLALGSLIAAALAVPICAQDPAPAQQSQPGTVFRSGASLVALNVTVSDGKKLVPGLAQNDFSVYEDGVLQHVQFFEAHEVPIDLILLIDTSASMAVIDRLILRLAVYEFLADPDTPSRVVINEALELARTYSGEEAVGFVNGVLDSVRREIRPEP